MQQSQDSHFKHFHLLAYAVFWGGEFLVMLLFWLVQSVLKIDLRDMEFLLMGPVWVIMFVGAVLLLIGSVHLHLFENRITNLIMGLVSTVLQAGVNFGAWLVIWVLFLTEVLGINVFR